MADYKPPKLEPSPFCGAENDLRFQIAKLPIKVEDISSWLVKVLCLGCGQLQLVGITMKLLRLGIVE